eukprot:m.34683 g.34683  ORF g.34683 m.34683 type:complete len:341 (+) comp9791_c0_seq2:1833-2855(+)
MRSVLHITSKRRSICGPCISFVLLHHHLLKRCLARCFHHQWVHGFPTMLRVFVDPSSSSSKLCKWFDKFLASSNDLELLHQLSPLIQEHVGVKPTSQPAAVPAQDKPIAIPAALLASQPPSHAPPPEKVASPKSSPAAVRANPPTDSNTTVEKPAGAAGSTRLHSPKPPPMPTSTHAASQATASVDERNDGDQLHLSSAGSPPSYEKMSGTEMIRTVLTHVQELHATRQRLTTDIADQSNLCKSLLLRAEDFRLMGEVHRMKDAYLQLGAANTDLVRLYRIRSTNHFELVTQLKAVNGFIQQAAMRLEGEAHARLVTKCREAIKNNDMDDLHKLLTSVLS